MNGVRDLTDLRLGASHWVAPTGGGATAGAEPAGPTVHGRNEWAPGGWRSDIPGCGSGPTVMPQLRFAVVHHTVNANTYLTLAQYLYLAGDTKGGDRAAAQAKTAKAEAEVLEDASIKLVMSSAIPDERGPIGIRVMQRSAD